MIAHVVSSNVKLSRHDTFASVWTQPKAKRAPALNAPAKSIATVREVRTATTDKVTKLVARLGDPANRNRPATHSALHAYIKTGLGKESTDAKIEEVLAHLQQGVLTIDDNGSVAYATKYPEKGTA